MALDRMTKLSWIYDLYRLGQSPLLLQDPDKIYPHIYGPLNRDAIVTVLPILREADGSFVPPVPVKEL